VQWLVASMSLHGAGYVVAQAVDTPAKRATQWRLLPVQAAQVQPIVNWQQGLSVTYRLDGEVVPTFPAGYRPTSGRWLVPVPYMVTSEHPAGASPVTLARVAFAGMVDTETAAATLLSNGTLNGGRLVTDQPLTPDEARRYQDSWVASRRTGRAAVLAGGLRYEDPALNAADAQLLESRSFGAQQVCAAFGVPSAWLGLTLMGGASSLSYANAQDNRRMMWSNCLQHFVSQISDALDPLLPAGLTFDHTDWMGGDDAQATDSAAGA